MFDLFVLDKLQSQSSNLMTVINTEEMEKLDFNFIISLREVMPVEVSSIIFSNHFIKDELPFWYVLRLDRDKVELLEIRENEHTNVLLYFQSDKIRRAFSIQPLLVGGNPFTTTCIYSLIHFLERKHGVYFAMGGTGQLVKALARLMEEVGIKIRLNTTVKKTL